MAKTYRIYARAVGQSTFKAMDLAEGCQVDKLIHATLVKENELPRVMSLLEQNEGEWEFQAREVK